MQGFFANIRLFFVHKFSKNIKTGEAEFSLHLFQDYATTRFFADTLFATII